MGRPYGTSMKYPPTLALLAAPQGAGQSIGTALLDSDKHPPTLAPLAAPQGAGQSIGAALLV
jgi:hypothetical protein